MFSWPRGGYTGFTWVGRSSCILYWVHQRRRLVFENAMSLLPIKCLCLAGSVWLL